MKWETRNKIEKAVVYAFVRKALAAGYRLSVSLDRGYDTEDMLLGSVKPKKIVDEVFTGDEAHIFVHEAEGDLIEDEAVNSIGWVYVVLGNDGWDAIADYTMNLERLGLMKKAEEVSEKYDKMYG